MDSINMEYQINLWIIIDFCGFPIVAFLYIVLNYIVFFMKDFSLLNNQVQV